MSGICIVTGADGGIGQATVQCLLRDGWRVLATGLGAAPASGNPNHSAPAPGGQDGATPAPAIQDGAAFAAEGPDLVWMGADLTDRTAPDRIVAACRERLGSPSGLVHCAGQSKVRAFPDQEDDDWDALIDINLSSAHRMARAVAREMIAQGTSGAIAAISSIAWQSGGANPAYGAAKGGLNTLIYNMAQALGPKGIRANGVAPGIIATQMVRNAFPGDGFAALETAAGGRTPLRRLGRPEDVAEVIAFLMSPKAAFVTGTVIPVTGGIEMLPPIGNLTAAAKTNHG